MKAVKIVTHPYSLIISFLLMIISGEHLGGFYLLYLLLGLPYGAIHSLLAGAGISLLLFSYHKYKRKQLYVIEPILSSVGALLLFLSLFFFFYRDKEGYNYATFYQWIPLTTLLLFSFTGLCFLSYTVWQAFVKKPLNQTMSF